MLHNLQHRSLYRIQQLTTDNNVRQCTCISEADPELSIVTVSPVTFGKIDCEGGGHESEAVVSGKLV
jgi:hypothetical protein